MKPSDKALLGFGAGFAMLALAMLAAPFLPPVETPAMKLIELAIGFLSAVGTCSAFVVALYVGVLPLRAARQRATWEATLVAVTMQADINRITVFALTLNDVFSECGNEISSDRWNELQSLVIAFSRDRTEFISHEVLARMEGLPGDVVLRLAKAQSKVSHVCQFLTTFRDEWEGFNKDRKIHWTTELTKTAREGALQLRELRDSINEHCKQAAARRAVDVY